MKRWQKSRFLPDELKHVGPVSPEGWPICRWCRHQVSPPRKTFCSDECVHEWSLRTSGSYLRQHVFNRDKGVCAECNLDTIQLRLELSKLVNQQLITRLEELEVTAKEYKKSLWQADHILEVSKGGGCSGLVNMQTLCLWCHKRKTKHKRNCKK